MKSWVPIPILIPVNRGANPGFFPDPGQIGIPRFPGIPAKSGSGQNPEYFPDPGPVGIGKIPAIFPAKSGRGGAGFGDSGVWLKPSNVRAAGAVRACRGPGGPGVAPPLATGSAAAAVPPRPGRTNRSALPLITLSVWGL